MSPGKAKLKLGDSWVVEGEEDSPEDHSKNSDPDFNETSPTKPSRRRAARPTKTPEPQLMMPTLDSNSLDGSWVESSRPTPLSRDVRLAEERKSGRRRGRKAKSSSPDVAVERKSIAKPVPRKQQPNPDLLEVIMDHAGVMLSWSLDVLGRALRILKTPISYALAIWLLFGIGVIVRNLITTSIYSSLSPICRIPGTSLLNLPFCPGGAGDNEHVPPVEFDQLMMVQSKFEEILEESADGVSLPMDMKRGEASIRDLRQLVKYSHINSKNELVLEFDGFIDTARIASYDLQKFNSHIGRAVDSVLSTTRWTTRVLDTIDAREASRGALSILTSNILAPFQPVRYTETALLDQYIQHTSIVEAEIYKLIDEAQALLMVLSSLEDRLEIIHGIVTRDDMHARAKKDEILSELWTMVGGNRNKLSKMDKQLSLLQQVGIYRKNAYAHVSGTVLKLQEIGAGLEDLRERVGAPELLRDRADIPLAVHIENIQRGVERLEEGRQSARKTENEHIKQTLERAHSEGRLID